MRLHLVMLLAVLAVGLAPVAAADNFRCGVTIAHCPWGGIDSYGVYCGPVETLMTEPICF